MTEAEWLATASRGDDMLAHVRDRGSPRLWRLLYVAALRAISGYIPPETLAALDVAERHADSLATGRELRDAIRRAANAESDAAAQEWEQEARSRFLYDVEYEAAVKAVVFSREVSGCLVEEISADDIPPPYRLPDILREIFGNPFRIPDLPLWGQPDGGDVLRLASSIYDAKRFDKLPVLADALEEFGCADAYLLDHLRSPGPHVRGCWALDLVLGKE